MTNFPFKVDVTDDGEWGYHKIVEGADTVVPFKSAPTLVAQGQSFVNPAQYNNYVLNYTATKKGTLLAFIVDNLISGNESHNRYYGVRIMKNNDVIDSYTVYGDYGSGSMRHIAKYIDVDAGDVISLGTYTMNTSNISANIYCAVVE